MPDRKTTEDAPITPQSFEAVTELPHALKPTAEEQKALDAKAENDAVRERLAVKAEAARFVRVRAED